MNNVKEVPSFKSLDSKMQNGYKLFDAGDEAGASRVWIEVWADVQAIFDGTGIQSMKAFDERFQGTQCLFNWLSDIGMALWNAGLDDPQFLTAKIAFCEEVLKRFGAEGDDLLTENARRDMAECYFHLGHADKVNALYDEWLNNDPRWGWGWIGWSDCYFFGKDSTKDLGKAEHLLQKGLAIADVRDRDDILERLADLLETVDRANEATEVRQQIKPKTSFAGFGQSSLPGDRAFGEVLRAVASPTVGHTSTATKTDRHKPCPCGSGKIFKECCGRGLR